jgi:hypothetical protein
MGLPGKPDGISGSEVEKYYRDGHIREIAEYARAMCSIPIEFGCGMNSFEDGYQRLSSRRARLGSLISLRHAGIRSRTLLISCRWRLVAHKPTFPFDIVAVA